MLSITVPAGGSLYYTEDLEKVANPGIPLEDRRFSVGPDTRIASWYGRRSQLDVDRGPYESVDKALITGAEKELVYMKQFDQPLLPFQRMRREGCQYQEQSPSDHIKNLAHYLLIISSLIPSNPALGHFCIRHPDLQPGNIIVSTSSDSNLRIVSLIDWQHTPILHPFLHTGIPQRLQNYDDPISESMTQPSLPESLDDFDETQQSRERELHRRRLVHYHYVKNTAQYNKIHYAALTDPIAMLRRRLFRYASDPWEGETLALKVALIEATKNWESLTGGGPPCPIVFDDKDVCETMELDAKQSGADKVLEACQNIVGGVVEGWVPAKNYEEAMARSKKLKEEALEAAESEKERAEITAHWLFDDMDETKYM